MEHSAPLPRSRARSFLVGLDGGATGTVALVGDLEGRILGWGTAGPANYHTVGREASTRSLAEAVRQALRSAGVAPAQVRLLLVGVAGLDHPRQDGQAYQEILEAAGLGIPFEVVGDVIIAWAGATLALPGLGIIAGTGCSAYGMNSRGETWKAGGWDYLLADEGSAYWIGLEGLRAAMRAYDGRGEATALLEAMVRHYRLADPLEMVQVAYSGHFHKAEIASFAQAVSRCAGEGDPEARRILLHAADEVARMASAVIRKLGMEEERFPLGWSGGVFRSGELFLARFTEAVRQVAPLAQIGPARYPPVVGALIYGLHRLGRLTPEIRETVAASAAGYDFPKPGSTAGDL
ncbi:MAG: BadF/BadG/BcrA/BcrD ATPase family protein [Chloroflexia bacterium]